MSQPRKTTPDGNGPTRTPRHKRFLTDHRERFLTYIKAAKTYVAQRVGGAAGPAGVTPGNWLFQKPYDLLEDHREFFRLTYNVLNLIEVMRVPLKGRILEVGSGPGWLTEILMGLSFKVYALEPSEDMNAVARDRVAGFIRHHHLKDPAPVHFLCEALEDCSLPDGSVDAVVFHEALHHVVDEDRAFAQCARVLVPNGVLGVTGESAWFPGNREQEAECEEEMARYGTLENPYTYDYLQYLLSEHGFDEVTRYHGVNGFFPESMGDVPLKRVAQMPAGSCNHITARKAITGPTSANQDGATRGIIRVLGLRRDPAGDKVRIRAELTNQGETCWLPGSRKVGGVTMTLCRPAALRPDGGVTALVEAMPRCPLPNVLAPGETTQLDAVYYPPAEGWAEPWFLDLVSENVAWFNAAVPVTIPA